MRNRGFSSSLLIIYIDAQALTELAFRKSGGAATCALVSAGSATERAAFRIPTKTGSSSPLALQKELYHADGLSETLLGRTLFFERCVAWTRGPVSPRPWDTLGPRNVRENSMFGQEIVESVETTFFFRGTGNPERSDQPRGMLQPICPAGFHASGGAVARSLRRNPRRGAVEQRDPRGVNPLVFLQPEGKVSGAAACGYRGLHAG